MPNTFAYIALFSWPLVVFILFRKLPWAEALIWSILGGYLLLPFAVGIKVKMLPAWDKTLVPALSASIICLFGREPRGGLLHWPRRGAHSSPAEPASARGEVRRSGNAPYARPRRQPNLAARPATKRGSTTGVRLIDLLLALLFISPVLTVLNNEEPLTFGPRVLPGLSLYDAGSLISGTLVSLLPFLLARRYLARPESHALLLRLLCISGMLYSLPTLFEIRMSPLLSRWVYGFRAQAFNQSMRDGGYRPVVFLQHGLWLAIFMAMATLAGFAFWRSELARGAKTRWGLGGAYLTVVLALCHSVGALMILIAIAPIVLIASMRLQLVLAAVVAASVLTYPALRGAGLVPVDTFYNFVKSSISEQRAASFYFRLQNEDRLLARANQKPFFGWGDWARGRVFNKQGRDITITDGFWIIAIGGKGWVGYIATFGLLTLPILLLSMRRRELGLSFATSGLCLVLAANLIDMIENATLTPVTWLVAGALAGRYGFGAVTESAKTITARRSRTKMVREGPVLSEPPPQELSPPPGHSAGMFPRLPSQATRPHRSE